MNSGALVFLFILIGCLVALVVTLVLIAVLSKGKKVKAGLKVLVVLLSIATCASFVTFPLAYHNYIDVNIHYGYFKAVDEHDKIRITRSSCEYYTYGGSDLKDGKWTLVNDKLTLYFTGVEKVYTVKGLGTELYDGNTLAFRYMTGE